MHGDAHGRANRRPHLPYSLKDTSFGGLLDALRTLEPEVSDALDGWAVVWARDGTTVAVFLISGDRQVWADAVRNWYTRLRAIVDVVYGPSFGLEMLPCDPNRLRRERRGARA